MSLEMETTTLNPAEIIGGAAVVYFILSSVRKIIGRIREENSNIKAYRKAMPYILKDPGKYGINPDPDIIKSLPLEGMPYYVELIKQEPQREVDAKRGHTGRGVVFRNAGKDVDVGDV